MKSSMALSDHVDPFMGIAPGYADLYRTEASLEDLKALLWRYPVMQWLSLLSRMNSLLDPGDVMRSERQAQLLYELAPDSVQTLVAEWDKRRGRRPKYLVFFFDYQIATLQELALLYAPEDGGATFRDEDWRLDFCHALLITTDLVNRKIGSSPEEVFAVGVQQQLRSQSLTFNRYFARAVRFYQLCSPDSVAKEYQGLFEFATQCKATDFIIGGMLLASEEHSRSIEEHRRAWVKLSAPDTLPRTRAKEAVNGFLKLRSGTLEVIKSLVMEREQNRIPGDFNMIGLSQCPVLKSESDTCHVLNLTALGRSIFDGIYHTNLMDASRRGNTPEVKRVNGLYGRLFETYVADYLGEHMSAAVTKIDESELPGLADFIINLPGAVVVADAKCTRFIQSDHFSLMNLEDRRKQLAKILDKGVTQVGKTIDKLRQRSLVGLMELPDVDWSSVPIVPAIISQEFFPTFLGVWKQLYSPYDAKLKKFTGEADLCKLRVLGLTDIENLPNIESSAIGRLLFDWGTDDLGCELTLRNYLDVKRVRVSNCAGRVESVRALKFLLETIGEDPSRVTGPASVEEGRHEESKTERNRRKRRTRKLRRVQ